LDQELPAPYWCFLTGFGNYRPGAAFPENDTRSAYGAEFNNRQLELVEKIRREELPPGQNMAQWALAWCLKNPAVASVIVGCKTIAQLESNAAAGELVAQPTDSTI
jgi:aryl-alcohol dehydrogenase-like predicted oxidoreductase